VSLGENQLEKFQVSAGLTHYFYFELWLFKKKKTFILNLYKKNCSILKLIKQPNKVI